MQDLPTEGGPSRKRFIVLAGIVGAGLLLTNPASAQEAVAPTPEAAESPPAAKATGAKATAAKADAQDESASKESLSKDADAEKDSAPIEVRIFGDSDDALQKVPGSRALVTAKEIRRMVPRDTTEIIRRVPSLTVASEDGHGLRLNVGLRGFDPTRSRSILVLEDGVPISINPYAEPDLYYSTTVDRVNAVELVKGSGAILYGPQTIAGVLNFLTPSPPDSPEGLAQIEAGQYGFFHALARYGDAVGDVRYLAQASIRRADGPREIGLFAVDAMGKVAFPTSSKGEMTVKLGFYQEQSNSTYVGLTREMFESNPEAPSLSPDDVFDVRRLEASAVHVQRLTDFATLRTQLYGYTTDRTWRRQRFDRGRIEGVEYVRIEGDPEVPFAALFYRDSSQIRDRHYQVAGIEPRLDVRATTGPIRHTITAGVRFHAEFAQRNQSITDFTTAEAGALETRETHRTLAFSAYAQDRIAFTDWLLVTPGLRFELAGYDRATLREPVDGVPTDVDLRGTSTAIGAIPGIGMVLGTTDINGFGGIHLGWAPPRVSAAITPEGRDTQLSAERSTNVEAGIRARPVPGLSLEAAGFLTMFANQIVPATASSGVQSELVNGGSTRHVGAEASVTVGIGEMADLGFDLSVVGRYTFADARFRGGPFDGNQLPYAPQHHASALVDFDHPFGPGAQLSWSLVGPQMTDEANNVLVDASGRVGEIPTYNVLDATVRWTISQIGLTPYLTMKNALNDVYVATRRPDGIHAAGFRQILGGMRWEGP